MTGAAADNHAQRCGEIGIADVTTICADCAACAAALFPSHNARRSSTTMHHDVTPSQASAASDLPVAALDYDLPERLIARRPVEPRDSARLLVVHRSSDAIEHRSVRDLPQYIQPDDLMVFNNTAVLPARIAGRRDDTGGRVEGLYLQELESSTWLVMLRSNGKLRPGQRIELFDADDQPTAFHLCLEHRRDAQWVASVEPNADPATILEHVGRTPLPPYILRARSHTPQEQAISDAADRTWYQTVYADQSLAGSVAAPTAGLHFTPELLAELDRNGVRRAHVTLHVGAGTFKPIETETIAGHVMHREWYDVPADVCKSLLQATSRNQRVIAVGTTAVRTLESLPQPLPDPPVQIAGETDLLIAPGYRFNLVAGLLTNFHLPRSTLLALVGALLGLDRLHAIYRDAIEREYRFYSYGDAMLILP